MKGDPGQPGETGLMVSPYLSNGFAPLMLGLEQFNMMDDGLKSSSMSP